jgi:hypothetical protein
MRKTGMEGARFLTHEEDDMNKVIVLALTLMATPAFAQEAMTGDELEGLLGNRKKIALGGPGAGYTGELTLKSDGTGSGAAKTDDGKMIDLVGVWYIEGNQFCRSWKNVDEGQEVCETWVKDGDNKARILVDGKQVGVNSW